MNRKHIDNPKNKDTTQKHLQQRQHIASFFFFPDPDTKQSYIYDLVEFLFTQMPYFHQVFFFVLSSSALSCRIKWCDGSLEDKTKKMVEFFI